MKKLFILLLAAVAISLAAGCTKEYDDSVLVGRVDNLESRVTALETLCKQINTNISSLQAIVNALQNNDYITSVTAISENGVQIGYTINFAKGSPITIYHGANGKDGKDGADGKDGIDGKDGKDGVDGKDGIDGKDGKDGTDGKDGIDGKDGKDGTDGKDGIDGKDGKDGADGKDGIDGKDGKDGYTPIIGVRQDADGIYYWTLDGEWLLDNDGNKIIAAGRNGQDGGNGKDGENGADGNDGKDGKDGKDGENGITPQLKIEGGYWYISYDNGATWSQLGRATGENGKDGTNGTDGKDGENGRDGDSMFRSLTQDETNVYLTLADGTVITIPKGVPLSIEFDGADLVVMSPNTTRDIHYTITSPISDIQVEVISSADIKAKVIESSSTEGVIRITSGAAIDEYSKVVVLVSNGEKVIMRRLSFEEAALTVTDNAQKEIAQAGGVLTLEYLSNMECEAVISEEGRSWITIIETRTVEQHTISFNIAPNSGMARSATIELNGGDQNFVYTVTQDGYGTIEEMERAALIAFYKATGGDNWKNNDNWCSDKPLSEWYGITTGSEIGINEYADNVYNIELPKNNLIGSITTELYPLSQLRGLFVPENNIEAIDVSHNYNLERLFCYNCDITELNTYYNENLKDIWCQDNPINKLNISNNSNLMVLDCSNCAIEELDISTLTQLVDISCSNNNITVLDISQQLNLESLNCSMNQISDLDVTIFSKLTFLSCWGNNLQQLNVSNNPELQTLWCGCTDISDLDISHNRKLKSLSCYSNHLTSLNFSNNEMLEYIDCPDNAISELDVSYCPNLTMLKCYGNPNLLSVYVYEHQIFAYDKDEFTTFIDKNTGEKIQNLYYISTDYSLDSLVTTIQTATKGKGIDVVLMGDAFSDRQIADGTYMKAMQTMADNLFTVEPYKSFKDMFNVYAVNVVSATEGYDYGNTALHCFFGGGTHVGGDDNACFEYALKAISDDRMDEALIVVAMNKDAYAGTCYMYYPSYVNGTYGSGPSVAYFPTSSDAETFTGLIHHEALGHGFPKLADEYAYEDMGTIQDDYAVQTKTQQNDWGWWKNVDFTNDPATIRWNCFLSDSRYDNEGLGAYEGGLTYWSGVWRPTENSIMRYNTGGFNAPSREAIYYRIHKLAYGDSWEYNYEDFVKYDEINRKETAAARAQAYRPSNYKPTHPPVIVNKSWRDAE